jgi:outer membrane protein OmpA-like peptidoglycan-associated protein
MKRLINSTTILSLMLYVVPPFAAQAQEFPKVTVEGTEVICLPDKKAECPEGAFRIVVKNAKNCEAKAAEAVAAAAAASGDQAAADKAAADKAAADQAAADQAAADKAAADQAAADKAAADKAAADQAAADQAAADQAAADQAAADQAAADKAAADKAAEDKAAKKAAKNAADAAAAEEAAAGQAEADKAAKKAAKKAADAAAADAAAAAATSEAPAVVPEEQTGSMTEAEPTEATTAEAGFPSVVVDGKTFVCLPEKAAVCPEGADCVVAKTVKKCEEKASANLADMAAEQSPAPAEDAVVTEAPAEDAAAVAAAQAAAEAAAAAAATDPDTVIIDAPVPTDEAVETLETALDTPVTSDEAAGPVEVEAATADPLATDGTLPADVAPSDEATVTTEVVTEADTRASTEEFAAAPATVAPGKKTGLSDFEKVGLLALGALVVGAIINGNKQVVSNTGDRVVVRQPDGSYQVYKDDNALLREPGSTVRTETYRDGSTRTVVQRVDGSQIVTIRDATGRVLQRVAYDRNGRGTVLIDDLQAEERVDVSTLPKPSRNQVSVDDADAELRAQLAAAQAEEVGRTFSLRQIRTIPEVRYLAPTIDVNNITFETGSSAIQASEARKLSKLGNLITQLIDANPNEVFLIEGHTDAVGSAASNLSLSDRRAESVAKALTEYFEVPPENLVVQGYGEGELKVDTLGDERANRRVAVRIVTTLLNQGGN